MSSGLSHIQPAPVNMNSVGQGSGFISRCGVGAAGAVAAKAHWSGEQWGHKDPAGRARKESVILPVPALASVFRFYFNAFVFCGGLSKSMIKQHPRKWGVWAGVSHTLTMLTWP